MTKQRRSPKEDGAFDVVCQTAREEICPTHPLYISLFGSDYPGERTVYTTKPANTVI